MDNQAPTENRTISRVTLLNITIFVEAFLLLLATVWSQLINLPLAAHLVPNARFILLGSVVGIGMAALGYALFKLFKSVGMFSQMQDLIYNYLMPLVSNLRWPDLLLLAAVSGFCEEVFFRGVLQPQFGLVLTSVVFGFFHDPSFKHVSYSVVAFLYGLLLGWLYDYTGSLWIPIMAHIVHNFISLCILRFVMKPPAATQNS